MATYKEIHGIKVQYRDSDATAIEGDVWYNSSTGLLKMYSAVGAWATTNAMVDDRAALGSFGTQTAAGAVGGSPRETKTEIYNGSTWTEVGDINTARNYNEASGLTTAALCFGGGVGGSPWATASSEEFNGTSWTEGNAMQAVGSIFAGFGIQTASIAATGSPTGGDAISQRCESYDGTNWAEVGDVNTARMYVKGGGTQTSGIIGPGSTVPGTKIGNVEQWNGNSWSEVADVNGVRAAYGMSKVGANTSALIFGGNAPSNTTLTEEWNGTAWTELADCTTGYGEGAGAGTGSLALKLGGTPSPMTTEEWTYVASIQTVAFD